MCVTIHMRLSEFVCNIFCVMHVMHAMNTMFGIPCTVGYLRRLPALPVVYEMLVMYAVCGMCVFVCTHMFVGLCMCIYGYVCGCVRMCMYVYMSVCVCP